MLVGIFTAITLALFAGGGQQSFFLNPDAKKDIKTYVIDKDRQKEIFSIIDLMVKDQKAFLKSKNKVYEKNAADLNKDYYAKREDFSALGSDYMVERIALQTNMAENEIKIRSLITIDEWNQMMANLLADPDKEELRTDMDFINQKIFNKMKLSCNKIISDTTARQNAVNAIDDQEALIKQIIEEYLNMDYYHVESLRNKDAKLLDFEKVDENVNKLRATFLSHYMDLRFDLIKNCTEEEWASLSKEFTNLFIKGKGIKT